jgi:hypothetical protein
MQNSPMKVVLGEIGNNVDKHAQCLNVQPFFIPEEPQHNIDDRFQKEAPVQKTAEKNKNGFDQLIRGVRIESDEIDMHLERGSYYCHMSKRDKKSSMKKKELDQCEFEEMLEKDEVYQKIIKERNVTIDSKISIKDSTD